MSQMHRTAPHCTALRTQGWLRERGATPRVDAANIEEALNKSLARLGTDYVDLLQVHWPDRYVPLFGEERAVWGGSRVRWWWLLVVVRGTRA